MDDTRTPADLTIRLKALADPARQRIVAFLRAPTADCCSRSDGVCACDLESVLGLSQSTVSHHMRQLVQSGLVRSEKRGRWAYYEIDQAAFDALLHDVDGLRTATTERNLEVTA